MWKFRKKRVVVHCGISLSPAIIPVLPGQRQPDSYFAFPPAVNYCFAVFQFYPEFVCERRKRAVKMPIINNKDQPYQPSPGSFLDLKSRYICARVTS
jgi:hypothetical protein